MIGITIRIQDPVYNSDHTDLIKLLPEMCFKLNKLLSVIVNHLKVWVKM